MFRTRTTAEQRSLDLTFTIDPGFVNRRLVQTIVGEGGMSVIDNEISRIPPLPDGLYEARIDHAYTKVALYFTQVHKIKTLGRLLAEGNGHLFCSTEQFERCVDVYDAERASSFIHPPFDCEYRVALDYSTKHIRGDTLRMQLHRGETLSTIAHFERLDGDILHFHPLVIGSPWLWHARDFVSHIVQIQTEVRDSAALRAACERLGLSQANHRKVRLFSAEATGLAVELPGWRYPVVCDVASGQLQFENFGGHWGKQVELDRLLLAYACEKSKIEARKRGHSVTEQLLADGSIKLTIQVAGGAL